MADQTPSTGGGTEGMDPKLAGLLCYIWIVGLVFLIISKDKFVRFHALQSVILGVAFAVISSVVMFIPIVNFFSWILWPLYMVLIIMMMIKAYAGEKYKLPIVGDFAEKSS
ncbi:MAG: hypothetical protein US94_C0046G0004 [Berkelbacteria bacterium GW2011_GWB1_38_5]|uniref:Chloroplast import component protein (Tic20) n=2 Tax=Candidatus Berkelbacteria TaxID=1618330 RepID=A0A0G0FI00_9BACT|nr:MAG: hypothetical protein US31_C0002G0003 [Berkelbacteria bacterium GW2011_GWA1_36_9]KKQ72309.1 MAG: hypothetical protein US94_C0046G0004 [Berkelbacteria bacterium GW2011_GWB1_38_5]